MVASNITVDLTLPPHADEQIFDFALYDDTKELWFVSNDLEEILQTISEHEAIRTIPQGRRIYLIEHGLQDVFPDNGIISPVAFCILVRKTKEFSTVWTQRFGWMAQCCR